MIIGKWVDGGADDGLEIPVEYRFFGEKRAVPRAVAHKKLRKL